jgi:hypothetical protein
VGAEATNAPAARGAARATSARSMEYDAFRAIAEKNIFNSKRAGRSPGGNRETRKPARVDSLSLVGTMNYDQGPLAFFQGSDSDYRKALAPGARIAGYQVASVQARTVTLQNGTNSIELGLGMEMRREDGGSWKLSESPQPVLESSSGSAPSSGSDAGGEENEVLKKLRQKREKEMQ